MVGAIDLNELAVAITTVTRLLDTLVALTARQPDAVVDHPLPQCLGGHTDVVLFEQLFLRERRSKVRIARPDERQRFVSKLHGQTSIALAAPFRLEARCTFLSETPADASHLPVTDAEDLGASGLCKPSIGYSKHYLQSIHFSRAQTRQFVRHRCRVHENRTFENGRNRTLLNGAYNSETCFNWTSTDVLDTAQSGRADATDATWTDNEAETCDTFNKLYCFADATSN